MCQTNLTFKWRIINVDTKQKFSVEEPAAIKPEGSRAGDKHDQDDTSFSHGVCSSKLN